MTTTITSKLASFVASKKNKKNVCSHHRRHFVIKTGFIIILVVLTVNSIFWFPFEEESDSFGHNNNNISQHEKNELMYLPTTASVTSSRRTVGSNQPMNGGMVNISMSGNNNSIISTARIQSTNYFAAKNNVNTKKATILLRETTPTKNRTLVILSGNLRCGELAWQSLYTNLLDVNSADLGLIGVSNDVDGRYPNSSLFQRAKYIWKTPEYEEWADALDLINGTAWRTNVLPQIKPKNLKLGLLGGIFDTPSSGAIQNMMRWWLSQYIQNDTSIDEYDTFVVTRTDQYYGCPFDLKQELRQRSSDIYIPRGEDYSGICDRFMVACSKDKLLRALDVLPPFLNDYDHKLYGKLHNPEGLLYTTLKRKKLRVARTNRKMFICASIDGQDPTRWRQTTMSSSLLLNGSDSTTSTKVKLGAGTSVSRREYGVDFKYKFEFSNTRYQCVRKPQEEAAAKAAAASKRAT